MRHTPNYAIPYRTLHRLDHCHRYRYRAPEDSAIPGLTKHEFVLQARYGRRPTTRKLMDELDTDLDICTDCDMIVLAGKLIGGMCDTCMNLPWNDVDLDDYRLYRDWQNETGLYHIKFDEWNLDRRFPRDSDFDFDFDPWDDSFESHDGDRFGGTYVRFEHEF